MSHDTLILLGCGSATLLSLASLVIIGIFIKYGWD